MTTETFAVQTDGTPLTQDVYTPAGAGPWKHVGVIHGGGFRSLEQAPAKMQLVVNDLVAAGCMVTVPSYRLAPPGHISGQVGNGKFPQQHDDIALWLTKLRTDARIISGSKLAAIGGSAGGSHVVWALNNGTIGTDRLDVGVGLSGAYKYDERAADPNLNSFVSQVQNYCDTKILATLLADSPVSHLASDMGPLMVAYADQDTMPVAQTPDLMTALTAFGLTANLLPVVTGRLHAFALWPAVKTDVLNFLAANL